jgi:predicted membrane channel-forming protein YqfA (hemolysin III family)
MRPQDRKQQAQKNQAIALQIIMMLAGIGIGTYFVMQAINGEEEKRSFSIFAAFGCYGVAAFYGWLQVRRWRREKRIKQIIAEKEKRRQSGSG